MSKKLGMGFVGQGKGKVRSSKTSRAGEKRREESERDGGA